MRDHENKGRRRLIVAVGVAVVIVAAAMGIGEVLSGCSDGERESFRTIRHLGGQDLEPSGHFEADSCFAEFTTDEVVSDVAEYYRDELLSQNWTNYNTTDRSATDVSGRPMSRIDATAEKEPYEFSVYIWSYDDEPTTHVSVHVAEYD